MFTPLLPKCISWRQFIGVGNPRPSDETKHRREPKYGLIQNRSSRSAGKIGVAGLSRCLTGLRPWDPKKSRILSRHFPEALRRLPGLSWRLFGERFLGKSGLKPQIFKENRGEIKLGESGLFGADRGLFGPNQDQFLHTSQPRGKSKN